MPLSSLKVPEETTAHTASAVSLQLQSGRDTVDADATPRSSDHPRSKVNLQLQSGSHPVDADATPRSSDHPESKKIGIVKVLQESIWDVSLLISLEGSRVDIVSVWGLLAIALNAFVQAAIVWCVVTNMATDARITADTVTDLRDFRRNVAHQIANVTVTVDPITRVPLAVQVCFGVQSLSYYDQVSIYQEISSYIVSDLGALLCSICGFMWFTMIIDEISSCLTTLRAVAHMHGKTTRLVDGKIESISTMRLVWFFSVQSVRLVIASALCYGGSKFIANAIKLGDLILNCVALEFVLNADEALFASFCPRKLKAELADAAEFELPVLPRYQRLDGGAILKLGAALAMIGIMLGASIVPQRQLLLDAAEALCGGQLKWAYETNALHQPLWVDLSDRVDAWAVSRGMSEPEPRPWTRPVAEVSAGSRQFETRFVNAMLAGGAAGCATLGNTSVKKRTCYSPDASLVTDYPWQCCMAYQFQVESVSTAHQLATQSLETVAEYLRTNATPACTDLLARYGPQSLSGRPSPYQIARNTSAESLGGSVGIEDGRIDVVDDGALMNTLVASLANASSEVRCPFLLPFWDGSSCVRPSCDDVRELCHKDSGIGALARFACSRTCGCASHLSPLFLTSGCSAACQETFDVELDSVECVDVRPNSTGAAALAAFATSKAMAVEAGQGVLPPAQAWSVLGCKAAEPEDFCELGGYVGKRSFMSLCPVTCGCLSGAQLGRAKCLRTCRT